jgi:tRNA nucleotidyltransferase/poly(A) polymerase
MIIYDYQGGLKDLNDRRVKFIGNIKHRIEEDYLRILRFIRFAIRFEENTGHHHCLEEIKPYVDGLFKVSIERIMQEFLLILKENNWKEGISIMEYLDIDKKIFNISFNVDFDNFPWNLISLDGVKDKIAFLILNNRGEMIQKIPIPNNIKKIMKKVNFDLNDALISNDFSLLFSIFSMNSEEINLLKIKTILMKNNNLLNIIDKIHDLNNNTQFIEKFHKEKSEIINTIPPSPQIALMIRETFYNLLKEFTII